MTAIDRVELLGCGFDRAGMNAAVERCLEWCREPRVSHTVVTMNTALLSMMRRDPDLHAACRAGDLIVPDGVPVVWTSTLAGAQLPERVAGVDLMARLLAAGSARGLSAYFLGARREVVDELVRVCERDYPGLRVAGARDGYFGPADHPAIVDEIARLAPDMLFVGMPSPFKETWCERNREALGVPVIMGVGGTFDVLTGRIRRAPRLFQVLGLEWFWRLVNEPRKMWKRYLVTGAHFLWLAPREILSRRVGLLRGSAFEMAPGWRAYWK